MFNGYHCRYFFFTVVMPGLVNLLMVALTYSLMDSGLFHQVFQVLHAPVQRNPEKFDPSLTCLNGIWVFLCNKVYLIFSNGKHRCARRLFVCEFFSLELEDSVLVTYVPLLILFSTVDFKKHLSSSAPSTSKIILETSILT